MRNAVGLHWEERGDRKGFTPLDWSKKGRGMRWIGIKMSVSALDEEVWFGNGYVFEFDWW